MKAIIVDDDKFQRDDLQQRLGKLLPDLIISAVCSNVDEAIIAVARFAPKVVFLDVEMPGKNGFDFIQAFDEPNFGVIFTTSHAGYAVRAFRVSAIDFLLKPYADEHLMEAVSRFKASQSMQHQQERLQSLRKNLNSATHKTERLALPTQTGFIFVDLIEIVRLQSENTYTNFFLADGRQIVVSRTMKECEEQLRDSDFLRVHQSHLINLRHIRKYHKGEGGTVDLSDGSNVEISRRKKEEFLEALHRL